MAEKADSTIIPARRMATMRTNSLRDFSFCMELSLLCRIIKLHFILPFFLRSVKPLIDFIFATELLNKPLTSAVCEVYYIQQKRTTLFDKGGREMSNSNQPFHGNYGYNTQPVQNPEGQPGVPNYGQPQQNIPPQYMQNGMPQQNGYGRQYVQPQNMTGTPQQVNMYKDPSQYLQKDVPQQPRGQYTGWGQLPNVISRDDFIKYYAWNLKKEYRNLSIGIYCIVGFATLLTIVLTIVGVGNLFGLIDYALIFGLALAFQLTKKRGLAIALLVVGILEVVLFLVLSQQVGGVFWLISGIFAVRLANKCERQYRAFLAGDPYFYLRK